MTTMKCYKALSCEPFPSPIENKFEYFSLSRTKSFFFYLIFISLKKSKRAHFKVKNYSQE